MGVRRICARAGAHIMGRAHIMVTNEANNYNQFANRMYAFRWNMESDTTKPMWEELVNVYNKI